MQQEGSLSNEASLIILDLAEETIKEYQRELNKNEAIMFKFVGIWVQLLQRTQSHFFLHRLFATLRRFVTKFRKLFFSENTTYCGDLCQEILRYCNFTSQNIRGEASAFLYVLIKVTLP